MGKSIKHSRELQVGTVYVITRITSLYWYVHNKDASKIFPAILPPGATLMHKEIWGRQFWEYARFEIIDGSEFNGYFADISGDDIAFASLETNE